MRLGNLSILLVLAAGCTPTTPTKSQGQQQDEADSASGDLTAKKVEGVWIFYKTAAPRAKIGELKIITTDARDGGRPNIKNDCLLVDDEVVIWWSDQIVLAERTIRAAKKERPPNVSFRGEGWTADAPALVAARCGVERIRYAGANP